MTETPVEISPRKPRMRLSASRVGTWMTCPMMAKFQYIDKLPRKQHAAATFGSAVHKAMEVYETTGGNVDTALATFKDWWGHPEKYGIDPEIWGRGQGQTFGGMMKLGVDAIKGYHDNLKWPVGRQVLAVEHPFLVPFGDFELTGYIDLLETRKNGKGKHVLRITDYKTNGKAPYMVGLKLNIQFSIYDYASRQPEFWTGAGPDFPGLPNGAWQYEMTKDLPRENIWYGIRQNKAFDAGERDDADFQRLYRVAKEIERALDHEVYVPNLSGDSCTFCSYTKECRLPFDPQEALAALQTY